MLKDQLYTILATALKDLNLPSEGLILSPPNNKSFGDYATNIALQLAKTEKKNPMELAQSIIDAIEPGDVIEKVEVMKPGFINILLTKKILLQELSNILEENNDYGKNDWGKGKRWVIEHTSPNPNKAMHLGHLRNNVTGMAIANLWECIGIEVIRDAIDNNRGIAIAKLMWGYLKFAHKYGKENYSIEYWYKHQDEWSIPNEEKISSDKFMDKLYVKGAEDVKKHKESEKQVKSMVVNWEAEDKITWALWEKVLSFVYKGQQNTLKRLGSKWDNVWHEHEHYKRGKAIVLEGLEKGVFKKLENGAVLTNLEKYHIPNTIVLKQDGTALYITQDLALTLLKIKEYKPDKLFWVIGPEQSLALKQMFAVCEQLGHGTLQDFVHIPYGYISIKGKGKMSSRAGNVVYIDDLIDEAKKEIKKKINTIDIVAEQIDGLTEKIAIAAIKYSILKVGRTTDTEFDYKTSLSMEGNSGPYVQYTYVRCKSVLGKVDMDPSPDFNREKDDNNLNVDELNLLRTLSKYSETVLDSAQNFAPNYLCLYLYDLSQKYNLFYQKHKILKAEHEEVKQMRLTITKAVAHVLQHGLTLLGIQTVEKM